MAAAPRVCGGVRAGAVTCGAERWCCGGAERSGAEAEVSGARPGGTRRARGCSEDTGVWGRRAQGYGAEGAGVRGGLGVWGTSDGDVWESRAWGVGQHGWGYARDRDMGCVRQGRVMREDTGTGS